MAAHIEWLNERYIWLLSTDNCYLANEVKKVKVHATSLLEAEREMVEVTWNTAYNVGCVVGGNDYTNEQDEDTGFHYFTNNYQQ